MHWLLAPDAFKGCLSALQVAEAMAAGISRADPDISYTVQPMADGGEGTLEVLHRSLGGDWLLLAADNFIGKPCQVDCLMLPDGTACIEAARVIGLPRTLGIPLWQRSSRGLGQLMRACLDADCRRLVLTLGGSATNDGGAGCLMALGAVWLDHHGQPLEGSPEALTRLSHVDLSRLDSRLTHIPLEVWCDVDRPLLGEQGATYLFARQKGACEQDLPKFEALLSRIAECLTVDKAMSMGAGAAGGLGFALQCVGGVLRSGAVAIADLCLLDQKMQGADRVLTGEGRADGQTLTGKAPYEVARRARLAGVPVSLLAGSVESLPALSECFDGLFSLCKAPMTLTYAQENAAMLIADAAEQLARFQRAAL